MDTPEKTQIGTPISKFEDSPVFNYINNLSPIKPVKSHVAHSFQSLSFASISSVFTSPQISSLEKSRFLKRNHLPDSTKAELRSDDGDEGNTCNGDEGNTCNGVPAIDQLAASDARETCDIGDSTREDHVDSSNNNCRELVIKLSRTLQYDYGSPNSNARARHTLESDLEMEMADEQAALISFVQEGPQEIQSSLTDVKLRGKSQLEQVSDEEPGCDWENLISDAADLLIFDSSATPEACRLQGKELERDTKSFTSTITKLQEGDIHDSHNTRVENRELNEVDQGQSQDPCTNKYHQAINDPSKNMEESAEDCIPLDPKVDTQQQRGMRRRCLVFELIGHSRNLVDDSKSSSSTISQCDGKFTADGKQVVPLKHREISSPCVLPGIGLHLNTLAAASKNRGMVKQEILTSGRRLISMPNSVGPYSSVPARQKALDKPLVSVSTGRDLVPTDKDDTVMQDTFGTSGLTVGEDYSQASPKKKRRKLESALESEACKRCNCKKSKCLKLYCECFAAGVYCVEPCSCQDCYNKPIHEDTVLATRKQIESRNPLAFAPKVIRSSESVPDIGEDYNKTPASARHKRGCNCKKSSCNKKYCECYQGGVGCSINCRCEGCKNAFGRKDGISLIGMEEVEHEEETEALEKDETGKSLLLIEANKEDEPQHYSDSLLPTTPFPPCRGEPFKLPSYSIGKPPRSSSLPSGSIRRTDFMYSHTKFEKHFRIMPDDETPEILKGDSSPVKGVKTTSPNSKRVSPPHNGLVSGFSPGRRSSRKLILQSIPSLPTLTPFREKTNDFPS